MGTQQSKLPARTAFIIALLAPLTIALPSRAQCYVRLIDHYAASGPSGADRGFGVPIVLSRDGSTMLVGRSAGFLMPDVYVFNNAGGTWTQSTTLRAVAGSALSPLSASFAYSAALSADGSTALVSAPNVATVGQVLVFVHDAGGWSVQGPPLTPAGVTAPVYFGCGCALSADGNTALIGAPQDQLPGQSLSGAAYIFTRNGTTWTQQGGRLPVVNAANSQMGCSVALSADGNTAAVGGVVYGTTGAVFVFTRSNTTWTQQGATILPVGGVGTSLYFGFSVALSDDGNTMAVGAIFDQNDSGAAYLFTRTGSTWTQRSRLTEAATGYLGQRLGLSADGSTLFVAAPYGPLTSVKAIVYSRSGNTWTRRGQPILAPPGALGYFGLDIAISADGRTGFVGSGTPPSNISQPNDGAVFRFDLCASTACAADFNASGSVSVYDIFDFLAAWFAADPRADFDGMNGLNQADIFAFLNAWFAGC
jgi:hypothetical protein